MSKTQTIANIKADAKTDGDLVLGVLQEEIANMHDETMHNFCMGIDKEVENFFNSEAIEIESEETTTLSQQTLMRKRQLLEQRQQLVNELFAAVRQNVIDALDGPLYKDYCKRQIDALPSVSNACELHARKQDKDFLLEMMYARGLNPKYVEINATCGGFLVVDPKTNFEVDCRLKSRIGEARKWFEGHSGLTL